MLQVQQKLYLPQKEGGTNAEDVNEEVSQQFWPEKAEMEKAEAEEKEARDAAKLKQGS